MPSTASPTACKRIGWSCAWVPVSDCPQLLIVISAPDFLCRRQPSAASLLQHQAASSWHPLDASARRHLALLDAVDGRGLVAQASQRQLLLQRTCGRQQRLFHHQEAPSWTHACRSGIRGAAHTQACAGLLTHSEACAHWRLLSHTPMTSALVST